MTPDPYASSAAVNAVLDHNTANCYGFVMQRCITFELQALVVRT